MEEALTEIDQLVINYRVAWAAVDKIETTRVLVRLMGDSS
jgi:hypothetical protein